MLSVYIFKSKARGMQYGIGTYISALAEALLKYSNIRVCIVNYHSECNDFKIETVSSRFSQVYIPSPKINFKDNSKNENRYASSVVNLLTNLIPINEDVVFQFNFIDGLSIIRKLKKSFKYPVISVVHFSYYQEIFKGNKQKLIGLNIESPTNRIEYTLSCEKEMYDLSDRIISVTEYMKNFLVKEYKIDAEKIDVVPNGICFDKYKLIYQEDKLKLRNELGLNADEIVILFAGRLDQAKGVFFLLEAFVEACKFNDKLRLIIAGQGKFQECMKNYQAFYGRITFTGFINQSQLEKFMQIADIGIAPSVYDHCPYSILEMVANRIPLILSEVDGLTEILDNKQCFFIKPEISVEGDISFNKEKLAILLLSALNDKNALGYMVERAFTRLISKFNLQTMGEKTASSYKSVVKYFLGKSYGHVTKAKVLTI